MNKLLSKLTSSLSHSLRFLLMSRSFILSISSFSSSSFPAWVLSQAIVSLFIFISCQREPLSIARLSLVSWRAVLNSIVSRSSPSASVRASSSSVLESKDLLFSSFLFLVVEFALLLRGRFQRSSKSPFSLTIFRSACRNPLSNSRCPSSYSLIILCSRSTSSFLSLTSRSVTLEFWSRSSWVWHS